MRCLRNSCTMFCKICARRQEIAETVYYSVYTKLDKVAEAEDKLPVSFKLCIDCSQGKDVLNREREWFFMDKDIRTLMGEYQPKPRRKKLYEPPKRKKLLEPPVMEVITGGGKKKRKQLKEEETTQIRRRISL